MYLYKCNKPTMPRHNNNLELEHPITNNMTAINYYENPLRLERRRIYITDIAIRAVDEHIVRIRNANCI